MTEEKENCNFQQNYNVFGLDDKPCCYLYHKYCDEIDSCYFKRCKRLEQENENLKKEVKQIGSDFIKKGDYARELEQENRELKEKYSHVLELAKTNADSNEYCLQGLEKKYEQLRSALEEINLILDELKQQYDYMTDYSEIKEIQDKINEVLND